MQKIDLPPDRQGARGGSKVTGVTGRGRPAPALTRADVVKKVLENPSSIRRAGEQAQRRPLHVLEHRDLAREPGEAAGGVPKDTCIGTETAIGDAIKTALNSLRGQYVAGVVVFSDGKNNAGMATKEIASQLKQRYLPIYTVAAGIPHTPKDIALLELEAREAVLANDQFEAKVKVSSFGYEGDVVTAELFAYPIKEKDKEPGQDPQSRPPHRRVEDGGGQAAVAHRQQREAGGFGSNSRRCPATTS
jgi:hypothetical protein